MQKSSFPLKNAKSFLDFVQKSPFLFENAKFSLDFVQKSPFLFENAKSYEIKKTPPSLLVTRKLDGVLGFAPAKECRQPDSNRHEVAPVRFWVWCVCHSATPAHFCNKIIVSQIKDFCKQFKKFWQLEFFRLFYEGFFHRYFLVSDTTGSLSFACICEKLKLP